MNGPRELYKDFIADVADCLREDAEAGVDMTKWFLFQNDPEKGLVEQRFTRDYYTRMRRIPVGCECLCLKRKQDDFWVVSFGFTSYIALYDGHGSFLPDCLFDEDEIKAGVALVKKEGKP